LNEEWNTRQSLVLRAKDPTDEEAWADFVKYYERFIYHLLHRMNINADDFEDMVQVVLVKLWKNLQRYEKKQAKFRTWLAHVVRNAVYDFYKAEQRRGNVIASNVPIEESNHASEGSDLEQMIQKEWELYMTNFALERLRGIFSETAMKVFEFSLEGRSAKAIAEQLDISIDSVYTLKNRVKARFIKEVNAIMREVEF
jgi:RNA polymerase sigma-70 factor (ECF subfamily)